MGETKPKHFVHRGSRISSFLSCEQSHDYSYEQGLTAKITKSYFNRGTVIHHGFEEALRWNFHNNTLGDELLAKAHAGVKHSHQKWVRQMELQGVLQWVEDDMDEMLDLCIHVAERTLKALDIHKGRFRTLALPDGTPIIEHNIRVTNIPGLLPDSVFSGTLDWACHDNHSDTDWLSDWKSRKQFQSGYFDRWQYQAPLYQYILYQETGIELNGTATLQLKAEKPKKPELLKSGKMSRKAITSDWPTYREAVREAGLDPADYMDMLEKFPEWQRWDAHYRTLRECEAIWHEAVRVCQRIEQQQEPTRALSPRTCNGCQYAEICAEQLVGGDALFLINDQFRIHYRE